MQSVSEQSNPHRKAGLLNALVLAVLCLVCCTEFWCGCGLVLKAPDTAWLIRSGDYILSHQALPARDIFSWTASQRTWVLYQWLFEIVVSLLDKTGGVWLVGCASLTTVGILYFYALPRQWSSLRVPAAATLTCLALVLSPPWFAARPQLCSYVLIFFFLSILEEYRQTGRAVAIWWLPPLMVLWVNLHSFWFIGLLSVAGYAILGQPGRDSVPRQSSRRLLCLVTAACMVAVLVNPYGLSVVGYNCSFITDTDLTILELQSPLLSEVLPFFAPFLIYLLLFWVLAVRNRNKLPPVAFVLATLGSAIGLSFRRYAPVGALLIWPYLGLCLQSESWPPWVGGATLQSCRQLTSRLWLLIAIAVSLLVWVTTMPSERSALNAFTHGELSAMTFLKEHRFADRRQFNDYLGSYLIFFGITPVFIDTRYDVYGRPFSDLALKCVRADSGWRQILVEFGITSIIISNDVGLHAQLMKDPGWLLVFQDGSLSFWAKNQTSSKLQIESWKLSDRDLARTRLPGIDVRQLASCRFAKHLETGRYLLESHLYFPAADEFRQALDLEPSSPQAIHYLIQVYAAAGMKEDLTRTLESARPLFWRFPNETAGAAAESRSVQDQLKIRRWADTATDYLIKKHRTEGKQAASNHKPSTDR